MRHPYWRIVRAAKDRQWVRLMAGNHKVLATTETYARPRTAQRAVTLARVAVAVELAEALRESRGFTNPAVREVLAEVADYLPHLAENLPDVEVREVGE